MARQGRAGSALGMSAIGSFFLGGSIGGIALIFICVPLAEFSLTFGPAEYFSLIFMGMLTVVYMGGKWIAKSLMSVWLGLAFCFVGTDPIQGAPRFVYGFPRLMDGISFVIVVMGVFGIGEVLVSAEERLKVQSLKVPFSPSAGEPFQIFFKPNGPYSGPQPSASSAAFCREQARRSLLFSPTAWRNRCPNTRSFLAEDPSKG